MIGRRAVLGIGMAGALATAAALLDVTRHQRRGVAGGKAEEIQAPSGFSVGGPFTLIDQNGRTVTDKTFRGRWQLIYFGYTHCPDTCPLVLQHIALALSELGKLAKKVVPIFISVDPTRDTPALMARYVQLFDPRIVGLTGSPAQISVAAREFKVYYVPDRKPNDYLIDHSAFIYLMDSRGRFRALFDPTTTGSELAASLRRYLPKPAA